jgi:hypothetical protein
VCVLSPQQVDHHKSRVLKVPSLAPFERRNVRHYSKHDGKGRPMTEEDEKARSIRADKAAMLNPDRRAASVSRGPWWSVLSSASGHTPWSGRPRTLLFHHPLSPSSSLLILRPRLTRIR